MQVVAVIGDNAYPQTLSFLTCHLEDTIIVVFCAVLSDSKETKFGRSSKEGFFIISR